MTTEDNIKNTEQETVEETTEQETADLESSVNPDASAIEEEIMEEIEKETDETFAPRRDKSSQYIQFSMSDRRISEIEALRDRMEQMDGGRITQIERQILKNDAVDPMLKDIYASRQTRKILTGRITSAEYHDMGDGEMVMDLAVMYGRTKIIIRPDQLSYLENLTEYQLRSMIGAEVEFIVIGIVHGEEKSENENKIVFALGSRVAAQNVSRAMHLPHLKLDTQYQAKVLFTTKDYIVVDCSGFDFFLRPQHLSYSRIRDCRDRYQINEVLPAIFTEINMQEQRISLSVRNAVEDPFFEFVRYQKLGDQMIGTVDGEREWGLRVLLPTNSLGDNVVCHCDHVAWGFGSPRVGDEVLVNILNIDPDYRRINGRIQRLISRSSQ
ncbi:MAG: hypothetical protein ACOX2M_03575 [Fastidiosipilaceae bacterium]|jgi:small subunit ribosomal protein S1